MKIVIFGLSITSSWGNGHATTYRSLARALRARGHRIVFFEKDQEWYASNRDMPEPPFCDVRIYENWQDIRQAAHRELRDADVAMVGSYCPDGLLAIDEVLDSAAGTKAFYDIDTPITMAKLRSGDTEYIKPGHIPGFDVYFSFTGGPMLGELESEFGAQNAVPLYCSFDPDKYSFCEPQSRFVCDLSYMGTYARDRQSKLNELFCNPAQKLPGRKFLLAGPQYPKDLFWPSNVERIIHLEPRFHPAFYCSSRLTLNLTRKEMVEAGYSPSVRLFEAAGCGATIVSDEWKGIDTFFTPGEEILLANSSADVIQYADELGDERIRKIGRSAQERVLAEHSSIRRAIQFEECVNSRVASS
ncbi:MAG TPA: glycosyltransferase [Terriglobales bacterium]|nr:glycosyltransferase [Terriglobales bacterium]